MRTIRRVLILVAAILLMMTTMMWVEHISVEAEECIETEAEPKQIERPKSRDERSREIAREERREETGR